jgi:hypothetical protein
MSTRRWEPDPAEVAVWVEASCAAQELDAKITEPAVLDEAAHLLRDRDDEAAA